MPGSRALLSGAWLVLSLSGTALPAAAQTAQVCLHTQLRTAGTICHGLSRCYATAIKRSAPYVDADCVASRSSRLDVKFANEEAVSNCLVEPASAATFGQIAPVMESLWTAVKPNKRKCGPDKMAALGRACKQYLACFSDAAARSQSVDPTCLEEAHTKLGTRFAGYETSGDCGVIGDLATLEPQIVALVGNLETLLYGSGTTTTTFPTTSTTTTTTLLAGDCLENGAFDPCIAYRDNAACTSCVDSSTGPDADIAREQCAAAGPDCHDAFGNAACGYAINTATSCGAVCCP